MGKKALGQKEQRKLTSYSGYKHSVRRTGRKRNVFPFLELPVELRLQIYQYALPNRVGKRGRNKCHVSGVCCVFEGERQYQHPHPKGFPALMSVNKLIYQETLDVLYGTPPPGSSPIIQLDVGSGHIQVRGYNIFCRRHHLFDKIAEGIFTRFPCVELNVHAYCHPWSSDEESEGPELYDDGINEELQLSKQSSLRNNLRWVVSQLRKVKSLSSLVLNQVDDDFFESYGHVFFMVDLDFIFSPLRQITSLEKAEIRDFELCSATGCDCSLSYYDEENEDMGVAFARFLKELTTRLTSKEPVEEEPELFSSYNDFIHRLKKCELTGTKVDTTEFFRKAQNARENGHPECLSSIMNRFAIAFRAEVGQRMALCNDIVSFVSKADTSAHGISELSHSLIDIPAPEGGNE